MCVAVVVETREGPTPLELWRMEDSNPHGAGLAWASGNLIRYRKGLTWKQVRDILPKIPRPALLHFRWATHGGRARHLSHPFPIGPRALTTRKLNSASKAVLIHNGVWTGYEHFAPEGLDLEKWSDTAVAAYAAGIFGEEILDHVDWSTAVGRNSGLNRMDVSLRGHWTEYNGNQYSNLSWKPRAKIAVYGGWGNYSDEVIDINRTLPYPRTYPSHSAHDDLMDLDSLPLGELTGARWDAEGRLVTRGIATEPEPLSQWLDEFEAAAQAKAGEDKP